MLPEAKILRLAAAKKWGVGTASEVLAQLYHGPGARRRAQGESAKESALRSTRAARVNLSPTVSLHFEFYYINLKY